jgi:hypothetical protein
MEFSAEGGEGRRRTRCSCIAAMVGDSTRFTRQDGVRRRGGSCSAARRPAVNPTRPAPGPEGRRTTSSGFAGTAVLRTTMTPATSSSWDCRRRTLAHLAPSGRTPSCRARLAAARAAELAGADARRQQVRVARDLVRRALRRSSRRHYFVGGNETVRRRAGLRPATSASCSTDGTAGLPITTTSSSRTTRSPSSTRGMEPGGGTTEGRASAPYPFLVVSRRIAALRRPRGGHPSHARAASAEQWRPAPACAAELRRLPARCTASRMGCSASGRLRAPERDAAHERGGQARDAGRPASAPSVQSAEWRTGRRGHRRACLGQRTPPRCCCRRRPGIRLANGSDQVGRNYMFHRAGPCSRSRARRTRPSSRRRWAERLLLVATRRVRRQPDGRQARRRCSTASGRARRGSPARSLERIAKHAIDFGSRPRTCRCPRTGSRSTARAAPLATGRRTTSQGQAAGSCVDARHARHEPRPQSTASPTKNEILLRASPRRAPAGSARPATSHSTSTAAPTRATTTSSTRASSSIGAVNPAPPRWRLVARRRPPARAHCEHASAERRRGDAREARGRAARAGDWAHWAVSERAVVGHGARGLQRGRHRVGVAATTPARARTAGGRTGSPASPTSSSASACRSRSGTAATRS